MAIDGIDKSGMAADTLRRMNQEAQAQEQRELAQKDTAQIEQERAKEQGSAGSAENNPNQDPNITTDVRADQAVQEIEDAKKTGVEMHEESVNTASAQQDRGEDWQQFSGLEEDRALPPSVDDQAKQAEESADRKDQEQKVNVADLLKEMAIQSGKISS